MNPGRGLGKVIVEACNLLKAGYELRSTGVSLQDLSDPLLTLVVELRSSVNRHPPVEARNLDNGLMR